MAGVLIGEHQGLGPIQTAHQLPHHTEAGRFCSDGLGWAMTQLFPINQHSPDTD